MVQSRLRSLSLLVLLLACTIPFAPALPAAADSPPAPAVVKVGVPNLESRIIELTNVERRKRGLAPLQADDCLRRAALGHSEEMMRLDYFAHESPTAGLHSVSERAARAGCTDVEVGENIAYYQGFSVEAAASRVVGDWMNSPGHRANILRPTYTTIGMGIAHNDRKIMISQEFAGHHLSFDSMRETTEGASVLVRLVGRTLKPTRQIGIFDDNVPLQRVNVDGTGRFSILVRLRASSGKHALHIGTLVASDLRNSSFDIYSIIRVNTDRVAVR